MSRWGDRLALAFLVACALGLGWLCVTALWTLQTAAWAPGMR